MKKLLILLIAIIPIWSNAQTSQVKVSLRNGTSIEGIVKEFDALDHITIIVGGVESTIPMSQVAYVSNIGEQTQQSSNTVIDSSSEQKEKIAVVVEDPLKDFKGFLLEKGNNVYVYYANSDRDSNAQYDKEGAMVIKSLLKKDGFWNVVDKMYGIISVPGSDDCNMQEYALDKGTGAATNEIDKSVGRIRTYKKKNKGLSAGAIIAIIIPCVAIVTILAVLILMNRKGSFPFDNKPLQESQDKIY